MESSAPNICANCGKEGNSEDMNSCNKCRLVKYCNAACKKKHRTKHKKKCDRRASELHDEKLFKEIEPRDECPICMLLLPQENKASIFKSCCGKIICCGCICAMKMSEGKDLCAFCRTPPPGSNEERANRTKKLMDNGNDEAFNILGGYYDKGIKGFSQDYQKANELYLKAGQVGSANGYLNLGNNYRQGRGVEVDINKANHYFELAAMYGSVSARYNLGCMELNVGNRTGNFQQAFKHFMISARAGFKESLDMVKEGFMKGDVTKEEYANTLRAYHERHKEMKSDERDKAEASGMF